MDLVGSDEIAGELSIDEVNNLKLDRDNNKMTIKDLAEKYGVSAYKIKRILDGGTKEATKVETEKDTAGIDATGTIGLVDEDDIKKKGSAKDKIISNDPFKITMTPTEGELKKAYWFLSLVEGIKGDYHIRRIHYRTLGKLRPDGEKYANTLRDTGYINSAALIARYLGLIDRNRIKDHKNPDVMNITVYNSDMIPIVALEENRKKFGQFKDLDVDDILNVKDENGVAEIEREGCKFVDASSRQPFHLELWVEKSTINDVLESIVKKFNMTLVVAGGQFSFTQVVNLWEQRIQRLRGSKTVTNFSCGTVTASSLRQQLPTESASRLVSTTCRTLVANKKVIIFYLRDFDPAGENMATAVARKLEWFVRTGGDPHGDVYKGRCPIGHDVRLIDLGLNYDQCIKYELPREPIDEKSEIYRSVFEKRYGEGATEIDSWVALKEEEFVEYLNKMISPYYDKELDKKIEEFNSAEEKRLEEYKESIFKAVKEIIGDELIYEFNNKVKEVEKIGKMITDKLKCLEISKDKEFKLRDPPTSSLDVDDKEQIYILDTRRDYDVQLEIYKILQGRKEEK